MDRRTTNPIDSPEHGVNIAVYTPEGEVANSDADETKKQSKGTILLWLNDDHYQALLLGPAGGEPSELDRWPEPVLLRMMVASAMEGEAGSLRGKGPTKKDKE